MFQPRMDTDPLLRIQFLFSIGCEVSSFRLSIRRGIAVQYSIGSLMWLNPFQCFPLKSCAKESVIIWVHLWLKLFHRYAILIDSNHPNSSAIK